MEENIPSNISEQVIISKPEMDQISSQVPVPPRKSWFRIFLIIIPILFFVLVIIAWTQIRKNQFQDKNQSSIVTVTSTPFPSSTIFPTNTPLSTNTPTPSITSTPTLIPTNEPILLIPYENKELGFIISYPKGWKIDEKYNIDDYGIYKNWDENVHYPWYKYSQIYFNSTSSNNIELGIDSFSITIKIYQNPKNLTLYNFFKGVQFGMEYEPNSTMFSEMIEQANNEKIAGVDAKLIHDQGYSDIRNAISRIYLVQMNRKIYEINFDYWYNPSVLKYSDLPPVKLNSLMKEIMDSFSII